MRAFRIAVLAVLIGTVCAGPSILGAPSSLAQSGSVSIVDFHYEPGETTVDAGTTVTWVNHGARPHTVTDRGGTFDTGPISPNASNTVIFAVPGRYLFFCRINPSKMNSVIVVRPGASPPSAVRIQAIDPAREGETLRFDPPELSVAAGTPVILANVGGKPHSLTADDGSFDAGIVTPGAAGGCFAGTNASVVVTKAGTYPFHCEVHPEKMKGVLTVTGEARAGPGAASNAPRSASIDTAEFAFSPEQTSVAPGGTVTWKNTGKVGHTATFDDVALDTGTIASGKDGALVAPAKPGSYSYRCAIHPAKMRGVLVVVAQGIADPTRTQTDKVREATAKKGGGGLAMVALVTAVIGAFLGGFGVSAFVRNRPAQTP
jgi:plastocyanin